jgi:hypothetical protein
MALIDKVKLSIVGAQPSSALLYTASRRERPARTVMDNSAASKGQNQLSSRIDSLGMESVTTQTHGVPAQMSNPRGL